MSAADPDRPRFLIVGVDWLGDALFMTPVFRALKHRWPGGFVAVTTASRNLPVLSRCRYIDEVRAYDEVPFLLGLPDQFRLSAWMSARRFDTALFLHRSFTRALAAARARVPQRVGFKNNPKRDGLLTVHLEPPAPALHRVDAYLSILRPLGVPAAGRHPEIDARPEDLAEWKEAAARHAEWEAGARYAVLHPGGNWDLKRWPAERFAELARRLAEAGRKVAVCGSAHEAFLGERIEREAAAPRGSVVSFCGKTGFGGLVGMLAGAELVVSNDSGPLHLAAALGTPAAGLFGPTLPSVTGPIARGRSATAFRDWGCELPCYFERCVNRVCLDRLTVDDAAAAVNAAAGSAVLA
jgi:lipopolysaccharide heptosyltransferase II